MTTWQHQKENTSMITVTARRFLARMSMASALILTLTSASWSGRGNAATVPALRTAAPDPAVFVFGQQGDPQHPLTITIDDAGVVVATSGRPPRRWAPRGRLSQDALTGLVKLALAEGFVTMSGTIPTTRLGVARGRFISLVTPTVRKRVVVGTIRNVAFDQLYAVLLAAADVIGDGPDGDLSPENRTGLSLR